MFEKKIHKNSGSIFQANHIDELSLIANKYMKARL